MSKAESPTDSRHGLPAAVVCPFCLGGLKAGSPLSALDAQPHHAWFRCVDCQRYYPVFDGIPVLRADRASLTPPLP